MRAKILALFFLVATSWAVGQDEPVLNFQYGDSCDFLGSLHDLELEHLIASASFGDLANFCQPEVYFDCADYRPFLLGFGELHFATDGVHCQLQVLK